MKQFKITFVCLGNICRSPAAESILQTMSKEYDQDFKLQVDSSGLGNYHIGNKADHRMIQHAQKRNYFLASRATQYNHQKDIDKFDYVIAMDRSIYLSIVKYLPVEKHEKVKLFTDYCTQYKKQDGIPDPYYTGEQGFELALDMIEDGCKSILQELQKIA